MSYRVLTVSRQFGSGGRSIAKACAERLGIPYYDKELVEAIALKSGLHPDFVKERGELAPSKSPLAYAFTSMGVNGVMDGLSVSDFLWKIQREVILQIAGEGPCVIVGRCADYVLKDVPDALHVFIHADLDFRADRIVRVYGASEKSPKKRLEEKDKKRQINYQHFTDRNWGDSQNYHLCLDSAKLGWDTCVDLICSAYKTERGEE